MEASAPKGLNVKIVSFDENIKIVSFDEFDHKFNPKGIVGALVSSPQVSPVALISRSELLRFTFNPFGVENVGSMAK